MITAEGISWITLLYGVLDPGLERVLTMGLSSLLDLAAYNVSHKTLQDRTYRAEVLVAQALYNIFGGSGAL